MANSFFSIDWRQEHDGTSFPFCFISNLAHDILFSKIFLDARVFVPNDGSDHRVFVSSISIKDLVLTIELQSGSEYLIGRSNGSNIIILSDSHGVQHGMFVIDSTKLHERGDIELNLSSVSEKIYLEDSCYVVCHGMLGVVSIQSEGTELSGSLGLNLEDGLDYSIRNIETDTSEIKINARWGGAEDCCPDNYFPLKSINNKIPDRTKTGNLYFTNPDRESPENKKDPRDMMKIEPINNGLKLSIR